MSLLQQIQESVVEEGSNLGSILLKLRLLAARLGSDTLAEWVKYECEGYPQEAEVPQYRKVGLTYKGTFSGPMGARIENSPIPPILIEEHAGKRWVTYDVRESIAGIEYLALDSIDGGEIGVDASNLILFLHNKIYENYSCNEVKAQISRVDISEIQQVVRSRILELTIEIEQSVPEALNVTFGSSSSIIDTAPETIQKISQQIIYGNVANAITGDVRNVNISVMKGDIESFKSFLVDAGFP
ncbi:hypothetical protein GNP73_19650 [Aliivibrio fischeri]|uniref:AbiTii domain-containing protein n=1 Tax=Aliivibrio fischeri TaxID=668 RepID=UPI0012DA693C|nr:hypothetical protein [Aliivibrio fischeri]MUJ30175.1 hypothetical protein [Aliivibrio fischeri]